MAARNNVLGDLKKPNDPDQQHNDIEAVFRIAEAERGAYGGKGHKPLQAGRSSSNGPERYRRKCEDRSGEDEQPCDPAEEDLGCHGVWFNLLSQDRECLLRVSDLANEGYGWFSAARVCGTLQSQTCRP